MTARKIDTEHKIVIGRRLPIWRRALSRSKKALVFTNGVFDILHAGHVSVLERARSLGAALIVGVNSDASVRRLGKGPERPLNPLKDRMRVLAGLACVDAVTSFSEDTPERLLALLKPDILVKGGDYRADEVAGRTHAGKVVILPLLKGRSTTALVKKLRA